MVKRLSAALFIPSHAAPCEDIVPLAEANIKNTLDIMNDVEALCGGDGLASDDLMAALFENMIWPLTSANTVSTAAPSKPCWQSSTRRAGLSLLKEIRASGGAGTNLHNNMRLIFIKYKLVDFT